MIFLTFFNAFCPSCTTRRMHDTAAHLVDRVLPRVPVRQWVLSRGRDRAEQGDEEEDKQEKPAPSAPLRPI